MQPKDKKVNIEPGKVEKLWPFLVKLHAEEPEMFKNEVLLRARTATSWKSLKDEEHCPNCSAKMHSYVFEFDVLDAVMLMIMGKSVRDAQAKGNFTDSNKIMVQQLGNATYAMKSRTTQLSKLGLIAKYKVNKRQVPGCWVVATRGWEALGGAPVQKSVKVWRNHIEDRTDEKITISEAFKIHRDKVEAAIRRRKVPKSDYRNYMDEYSPEMWSQVNVEQGAML